MAVTLNPCASSDANKRLQRLLATSALSVATITCGTTLGLAQTLPAGSLLTIDNGTSPTSASNTPNTFQNYSVVYTPTSSGSYYILFALRQAPAFWTLGNISVSASGGANVVSNGNFASGTTTTNTSYSQVPTSWGVVLQSGQAVPGAQGRWIAPGTTGYPSTTSGQGVNTATAGSWYDGAVQSYDGIYQVITLTAGVAYTISFSASGNSAASDPTIELALFASYCPSGVCDFSQYGFMSVVSPYLTNSINTAQAFYLGSTVQSGGVSPSFQGGTLRLDVANGVYTQSFTLDGSSSNRIDQFGNTSTFSGGFSDATSGTPGNITFTNSGTGGSVTLNGANTYTGTTTINNGATVIVGNGGSINNNSLIFNAGLFEVDAGASVNVAGVTNYATGTILNYGAITDALNNSGLLVNSGTYTADVNNFSTGTIVNSGTFNSGTFSNAGFVTSTGTLTASNSVTNSGTMNVQGTFTTPTLNNSGTFNQTGAATISIATLNNSGTFSMINGVTTDRLNTTTFSSNGGTLGIDVNSNATSGQRADLLTTTNLNGNVSLRVANVGAAGYITNPIPVITATNIAPGTTVSVVNGPSVLNYSVQQNGNTYNLVSTLNTSVAAATPTGINSILTALNTGFYQNASAFVSDPPNPAPNQINGGPWIRVSAGRNDVSSTTASADLTGTNYAQSKVRSDFDGFQVGMDLGAANIQNQGWNTHLGVTAGQVNLRTQDLVTSGINAQATVPFVGLYGAVNGHGFFADVQVRGDFYDLKLSNMAAGLGNSPLVGSAISANASAGYRYNLPSGWFIEPSAAFLYTQLHVDALQVALGGGAYAAEVFDPFASALGRAGLRIGTDIALERLQLNLQPFLTGSVWHEFAGNSTSQFVSNGVSIPLTVSRVGTFGQIGAGIASQITKTGVLGFIRGDYRFGDNIQGYALVAGLRYQF